ncbi:MAG: hypothetical protein JSS99_02610 [Actinobacteria bacterium]|nr:hypothetical protein [Actinomycetota bacterium]
MRPRTIPTTLIACVLLLALSTASAWANASDDRIIADCQNSPTGALRGSFTQKQLNHALNNLPGDIQEYTGCSEAIKQAMLAGAGGGSGGGSGNGGGDGTGDGSGGGGTSGGDSAGGIGSPVGGTSGSTTAAPPADTPPPAGAERPVRVAGATVAPGALPVIGKDSHRLPPALLVALALLGVAALVPAVLTIGHRVVGRRGP